MYFSTNTCFYVVIGLSKKGCKCIATQHPSNQNNIVCFCKTATKKQIIRIILMLRLNDAAPGEDGHWCLLIPDPVKIDAEA